LLIELALRRPDIDGRHVFGDAPQLPRCLLQEIGLTGVLLCLLSGVRAPFALDSIQAFSMAIANNISATAVSTNRAKVCIYLLAASLGENPW
jgi:hypothetical protein